jgi:hypothetical protein
MGTLIWLNSPTNHSGTVNFLYLSPDGEVGTLGMYMSDGGGIYLLGGPCLTDGWRATNSMMKLISLLPAGFHFFPPSAEEKARRKIGAIQNEISDSSPMVDPKDSSLCVYSPNSRTTECCRMLLEGVLPDSPIAIVHRYAEGELELAIQLARIYYELPKSKRS